jgi:aspartyl-tRNA synthetase
LDGRIVALTVPVMLSRKEIDEYTQFVSTYGAQGLAYIKINDINKPNKEGLQSPIIKFLTEDELSLIIQQINPKNGDTILLIADTGKIVNESMGALRVKIGQDKGLIQTEWAPLWVVDFPMFGYNNEEKRYIACHHPFTSPKNDHLELLVTSPDRCLANAYDMVLNGSEIGGGSVRIHQAEIQSKVFMILGISQNEAHDKFGFLLDNLQFGAPPHAGIAFGLDRIVALMCDADSIRDVIAFPKTTKGQCLLTGAPNAVSDEQLAELGLKL